MDDKTPEFTSAEIQAAADQMAEDSRQEVEAVSEVASVEATVVEALPIQTEVLELNLLPYTVFVTVGPTMCGKTSFAKNLKHLAEQHHMTAVILSSDAYRAELISSSFHTAGRARGHLHDRHSQSAMSVSRQAFDKLMCDLRMHTSFPINTQVIIVDTTGFSEQFRAEVCEIAQKSRYRKTMLCFQYPKRADYMLPDFTAQQRETVFSNHQRFVRTVLPNLKASMFDDRVRVKTRYTAVTTKEGGSYFPLQDPTLSVDETHVVIGDSHECVEELDELISRVGHEYPGAQLVHIGDYLDKGGNTLAAVRFMHKRVFEYGDILIAGNHEAYVARRLLGEISSQPEVEREHFPALAVLMDPANEYEKRQVLELWKAALPFLVCFPHRIGDKPVYITHAPCKLAALGKFDSNSIKDQRNYRIQDRTVSIYEDMKWLFSESDSNLPLHIFGHVSHLAPGVDVKSLKFKNRLFLDTGCVYGGSLSAAVIKGGWVEKIISVASKSARREATLPTNLGYGPVRAFNMEEWDLSPVDRRLLRNIEDNGIRYISGTMSPGPSTDTEIEPLDAALRFLEKRGVKKVIVEPKHMGSRAQLYLLRGAPEKTFMASRAGWKVRGLHGYTKEQYDEFLKARYREYQWLFERRQDDTIILDCELMPWASLGAGLIEDSFGVYADLVDHEVTTLVAAAEECPHLAEFFESKKLSGKAEHLKSFRTVLKHYSTMPKDGTGAYLEPFEILSDLPVGEQIVASYSTVSPGGKRVIVELGNAEHEGWARDMFIELTQALHMEGVVLKPVDGGDHNIPYMKVRSPEYLRLVYGYDYMDRLDRLCRQKRITGKLNLSIEEAKLARRMLAEDMKTESGREQAKQHAVRLIGKMREEAGLDPRL